MVETRNWWYDNQPEHTLDQPPSCRENRGHIIRPILS